MQRNFNVEFRGDYIRVELGPEFRVTAENQDEFWRALKAACAEHDSKRVLVEGFVPSGERETAEVIDAGKRAAAVPDLWLAFHLEGFVPNERSELFEVIARSSGVRVKFFSERGRALKWLRHNTPR